MSRLLRVLAFGLWSGVMIGFAFFFAPGAFAVLGPVPAFATIIARCIHAIAVFGYACTVLVLVPAALDVAARIRRRALPAATAIMAVVMAALSWFVDARIVPAMQSIQIASPAYQALHHESSTVYSIVLLLGLAALVWSAWQERPNAA